MNALREILKKIHVAMDMLSGLYLRLNDFKMYKEFMQKSDNLQLDIQWAMYSAQEILVALLAFSEQSKSSVESPASHWKGAFLLSQVTYH